MQRTPDSADPHDRTRTLRRRAYVATGVATVATAGCLGGLGDIETGGPTPGTVTIGDRTVTPETDGSLPTSSHDWPTFQFDARHHGHNPAIDHSVGDEPEVQWRNRVTSERGDLKGAPSLHGGSVFVTTGSELVVLDARTGTRRWSASLPAEGRTTPTATPETVFVGTETGLAAVDRIDAAVRWHRRTGSSLAYDNPTVNGAPTVSGQDVYVGTYDGAMHCFDTAAGQRRWTVTIDRLPDESEAPSAGNTPTFHGPASVADGAVYGANANGSLYSFDATSGERRWHVGTDATEVDMEPAPTVDGDSVFAVSEVSLKGVATTDGSVRWRYQDDPGAMSHSTVVVDDAIFVASGPALESQTIVALDRRDRRSRWRQGSRPQGSFSADGDHLYVPMYNRLTVFDRSSGDLAWEMTTRATVSGPPAVGDGAVFTADVAGTVYGIGRAT